MPNDNIHISKLRRSILQRHKLAPMPQTKQLVNPASLPSSLHKTVTQKMLEYKYSIQLEDFIFHGSLNDICALFKDDGIDRSTISKWRKDFKQQKLRQKEAELKQVQLESDASFFKEFP